MKNIQKMTESELDAEILRLFRQLTPEQKNEILASLPTLLAGGEQA